MNKQELVAEAQKRLEFLKKKYKLLSEVVKQFKEDGIVFYSERQSQALDGILYWVSNEPEYVKAIEEFEKEYGVVYHATLSHTNFGDLLSLFYVSKHKQEWAKDNADLEEGYTFAYVVNLTDDTCSEFGTIGFKGANGGLSRTE